MKNRNNYFPLCCFGCSNLYSHWDIEKKFSGGCIKSFGNSYCTGGSRHKKLLKRNIYEARPSFCPRADEFPFSQTPSEELQEI